MTQEQRLVEALQGQSPFAAAYALANELRDGGMSQADLLKLFEAARERLTPDADEKREDAALEVMDLIAGWCHPSQAMYKP